MAPTLSGWRRMFLWGWSPAQKSFSRGPPLSRAGLFDPPASTGQGSDRPWWLQPDETGLGWLNCSRWNNSGTAMTHSMPSHSLWINIIYWPYSDLFPSDLGLLSCPMNFDLKNPLFSSPSPAEKQSARRTCPPVLVSWARDGVCPQEIMTSQCFSVLAGGQQWQEFTGEPCCVLCVVCCVSKAQVWDFSRHCYACHLMSISRGLHACFTCAACLFGLEVSH